MGVTLVGHVGVGPLTPNLDSTPVTNHYKNSFTGGAFTGKCHGQCTYRGGGKGATIRCRKIGFVLKYGQCTGWGGKSGRFRTNHRATARCLWQRARALLNTTRWASQITLFSDRSYAGGSGGSSPYPLLNQPGAGYEGGWCTGINHDGGHGRRRNAGCLQHHAQPKRTD